VSLSETHDYHNYYREELERDGMRDNNRFLGDNEPISRVGQVLAINNETRNKSREVTCDENRQHYVIK